MKSTFVLKSDLAQAYFPHIAHHSARHKLMQLISSDSALLDGLCQLGYSTLQRSFSPAQMALIFARLGNPFT